MSICSLSLSKLSIEQINSIFSKIENERWNDMLNSSIVNPILGLTFIKSGALANIRFYGPGIDTTTENNKRVYLKDKSDFSTTSLAIALFPSEDGTLSVETTLTNTFYHSFQEDPIKGIEFLAQEFIKVLKSDLKHYESINENEEYFVQINKLLIQKENQSIY